MRETCVLYYSLHLPPPPTPLPRVKWSAPSTTATKLMWTTTQMNDILEFNKKILIIYNRAKIFVQKIQIGSNRRIYIYIYIVSYEQRLCIISAYELRAFAGFYEHGSETKRRIYHYNTNNLIECTAYRRNRIFGINTWSSL